MLDFLLRTWLRNTARQHVYHAARQAASEHLNRAAQGADEQAGDRQRPDRPCDVGLVFAQSLSAGSFEDRLNGVLSTQTGGLKFCQGGLRGRHVVHVAAVAGPAAARRAAELLIAGHRPRWVISAGFASGLQPHLERGDFVLATEVCNDQGQSLAIDLQLPPGDASRSPRVHAGKLLSIDQAVRHVSDKESWGRTHGALAADTESFAVAQVCHGEKTRFLAVKIINDALRDELPREIERLARKKSHAARWGAALGAIVHRPSSAKDLLELKERALLDADRLAKFLEGVIVKLAPVASSPPERGPH